MTVDERLAADVAAVAGLDVVPRILEVICRLTGMGFSAVARVTDTRWIACAVRDEIAFGLAPGGELPIRTTLCDEVRSSDQLIVIDDVSADAAYCDHHTPKTHGLRSYISVPIRKADGAFFGTLCAIDPAPARLNNPEILGMFTLFADLVGMHLEARDRLQASEEALADERLTAGLREQFVAVLGHDLRNPLDAIQTGTTLLSGMDLPEPAARLVRVTRSSAGRMAGLVANLLDFARARLGGGLVPDTAAYALQPVLEQVLAEVGLLWPDRRIDTHFDLTRPVTCDRERIAQLASNLVGNALTHGTVDAPVTVVARSDATGFEFSVSNGGTPIPADRLARLFQPFTRDADRPLRGGLGLGLYISSEIARAHGGTLDVSSTPEATRFTLRLPARSD